MQLEGDHFRIRDWRVGDERSLRQHADNRNVWINLRDAFPLPYTPADAAAWIRRATSASPPTNFAIEVDDAAVGGIGLRLGEDVHVRSAEIGFWLGEPFWGCGIMSEAVSLMTEFAFETFDICRIHAAVFAWNAASARVLEKADYRLEGRLRMSITKAGQTVDQLLYAAVRERP